MTVTSHLSIYSISACFHLLRAQRFLSEKCMQSTCYWCTRAFGKSSPSFINNLLNRNESTQPRALSVALITEWFEIFVLLTGIDLCICLPVKKSISVKSLSHWANCLLGWARLIKSKIRAQNDNDRPWLFCGIMNMKKKAMSVASWSGDSRCSYSGCEGKRTKTCHLLYR